MKAIIREIEFMGKSGVGVYINGNLSSFIISATDLLATIEALKDIGYKIDWSIDETDYEDDTAMAELDELLLSQDWDY